MSTPEWVNERGLQNESWTKERFGDNDEEYEKDAMDEEEYKEWQKNYSKQLSLLQQSVGLSDTNLTEFCKIFKITEDSYLSVRIIKSVWS